MIDFAYVQTDQDGLPYSECAYAFWKGCQQLGIPTFFFKPEEINDTPLRPQTLVNGGIGIVRKAFEILQIEQPHMDDFPPDEILPYYGRKMWKGTMGEVRERIEYNKEHVFIKPLRDQKAFTGMVTNDSIHCLGTIAKFENDFELLFSEPVNFLCEYRLFIHHGRIMGAPNYKGRLDKIIDFDVARGVLKAWEKQPVAFSLDMGLTDDGKTLIVEINDAFALGNYGLPSQLYAKLVIDRWCEIVGI